MSEQAEKTRKTRAKRWTEGEAREVLQEWRESGLSAVKFAAQRGLSVTRLSYWEGRLGQKPVGTESFVSVPLSSQHAVELQHRGVTVRLGALNVDEIARLVVEEPLELPADELPPPKCPPAPLPGPPALHAKPKATAHADAAPTRSARVVFMPA